MNWGEIAFIVSTVIALLLGGQLRRITREISELFSAISAALGDNNLTKEEAASILKEARDVFSALKAINIAVARKINR